MIPQPTAQPVQHESKRLPGTPWAFLAVIAAIVVVVRTELSQQMLSSKASLFRVPIDFIVYRRGGALVQHGQDVYAGGLVGKLPFTYPPFSAWLFSAFSHVPAVVGAVLWQFGAFLLLLIILVAIIAERGYRVNGATVAFATLLGIASFALVPIREGFYFGQINLLLMALVAADVLRSPANRWRSDIGIATGIAAGIKLVPAFFWLVFIVRRQWWALARSVAAFFVTVGIGFLFVKDAGTYWAEKMLDSSRVGEAINPGAQSLGVVLERSFHTESKLFWALGCVLILGVTIAVLWQAHRQDHRTAELGFAGVALVMISPFSWMHHWVWVVPVLLCVADQVITWVPRWWGTLLAILAVGVCAVPFITRHIAPAMGLWHQVRWPGPLAMGYVLWGMVLLVLAAVVLWWPAIKARTQRAGEGEPSDPEGEGPTAPGSETPDTGTLSAEAPGAGAPGAEVATS